MARVLGSWDCVVCGQRNLQGMRLRFHVDGDGARTAWTVAPAFQGFRDILQGGMVLAILDDCMWYAAYGQGAVTLTAEASIRYRAPVGVGEPILAEGRVVERRGRLWLCAAELVRAGSREALARAEGKFLAVSPGRAADLSGGVRVHELPAEDPGAP